MKFIFPKKFDKPFKNKHLEDPESLFTKGILFLYSMETFLPYTMNKASREQDESKVMTLGPFAKALSWVVCWA